MKKKVGKFKNQIGAILLTHYNVNNSELIEISNICKANKIALIEEIHKDGVELLDKHPNFEYELISDVSQKNLIKKLNELTDEKRTVFKKPLSDEVIKNDFRGL